MFFRNFRKSQISYVEGVRLWLLIGGRRSGDEVHADGGEEEDLAGNTKFDDKVLQQLKKLLQKLLLTLNIVLLVLLLLVVSEHETKMSTSGKRVFACTARRYTYILRK